MVFSPFLGDSTVNIDLPLVGDWEKVVCFFEVELNVVISQDVVREFLDLVKEDCRDGMM